MSKQWSCPIIMSVNGPADFNLCGFRCDTTSHGADSARINHLASHNPSPAQWVTAYETIQEWKERGKKQATA